MDDVLPSYGEATTRDYWSMCSSFVRSQDLCSAALVCREWNRVFMPHLWGNPAAHFGKELDAVYIALVRFKRVLSWASLRTRGLTHTLHLPPAQAELYDGPHAAWLQEILERLPKLQSLVVSQLPFFDHAALIHLDIPNSLSIVPMYSLCLLDASGCLNTTPKGLEGALKHFPALVYLDVSGTIAARSPLVLSCLWRNPTLQVFKARAIGLTDTDIDLLAQSVGTNLRSLDVRDNRLTDEAIATLVEFCFKRVGRSFGRRSLLHDQNNGSWNPNMWPGPGGKILDVYRTQHQDEYVRNILTTGFTSYLGLERTSGSGITHLFISGNPITWEGISSSLKTERLHVLDVGGVLDNKNEFRDTNGRLRRGFAGAETLTLLLDSCTYEMTYLRISHTVVTTTTQAARYITEKDKKSTRVFPQNFTELESLDQAVYEAPANHVNELPGYIPVYAELEGSLVQLADDLPKLPRNARPVAEKTKSGCAAKDIDALPPALFAPDGLFSTKTSLQTPSIRDSTTTTTLPPQYPNSTSSKANSAKLSVPNQPARPKRSYSNVLTEHEKHVKYRMLQQHALLPSMMSNLRTLVLTDVPLKSPTKTTAQALIQFISDCATESYYAKLRAKTAYALPPGPDRRNAERQYAQSIFSLRKIILEMAPAPSPSSAASNGANGWRRTTQMNSSVLDADCETFWNAAKSDFSFFGGGEECGQPDVDPSARVPLIALTEKMVIDRDGVERGGYDDCNRTGLQRPSGSDQWEEQGDSGIGMQDVQMFDVLADLSRFRREKKAEYEDAFARGDLDSFVEGYWEGDIVVIRTQ